MVGVACEMGGGHLTPQIHKDGSVSKRYTQNNFFHKSKGVKQKELI